MVKKIKNLLLSDSTKAQSIKKLLYLVIIIFAVNTISNQVYQRFDFTKEKRYTLAKSTKNLVKKLDDVVYITIYLEGDFPANYKRLRAATKDILNELRSLSNGNIQYKFEDVLKDKEIGEKEDVLKQFLKQGIEITRPNVAADDASGEKFIIPGGLVYYKGKEYPINLLKKKFGNSPEQEINESIELLEYEFGNSIRKCVAGKEIKLAFLTGHGELNYQETADIIKELNDFYKVELFNLNINDSNCLKQVSPTVLKDKNISQALITDLLKQLKTYKGIIIPRPRYSFTDIEKFMIDQYIMGGGRVIWLVESLMAEMDSVSKYANIVTADYPTNLNDILFRYGIRINPDLVQDIQCHGIPVLSRGGESKPQFLPWIFYPLLNPGDSTHPIVKNMSSVWSQFGSSIDTTKTNLTRKTVLLQSSAYSRTASNPVNINLNILGIRPNPALFNKPFRTCGILLEGQFNSLYQYVESAKNQSTIPYIPNIKNQKMIVLSDGDIIKNQIRPGSGEIYPLGYDRFASQQFNEPITFDNKKFFLNCVDYLCDETNLIEVRTKDIVLRLLNKSEIREHRNFWQSINLILPIALVIGFGLLNFWWRKRKYTKF